LTIAPPYPSTLVFESRITSFPKQLDKLSIKISSDDPVYVDTTVYKGSLDEYSLWFDFSIDDYNESHPTTISLQIEGECDNSKVIVPKKDITLDNCYFIYIGKEEDIKYKENYIHLLENSDTPCGNIDDWYYSIGSISQLGNRKCKI
jgi:hypothetical protein